MKRAIRRGIIAGLFTGFVGFLFGGWSPIVLGVTAGVIFGVGAQTDEHGGVRDGVTSAVVAALAAGAGALVFDLWVAEAAHIGTTHPTETVTAIVIAVVLSAGLAFGLGSQRGAMNRGRALRINAAVFVLLLIAYPFIDKALQLSWLASLIFAEIFALLAIGLNIVVGFAGLLDLGYAAFFAIGAYSTGLLSSAQHNIHINFWILIWISATAAAISGLLLGAPTLGLRGDYLAIVTLGFGEIVPVAAMQLTTITIEEPLTCWIIPSVQRLLGGEGTTRCLSLFNEFDLTAGVRGVSPIDRPVLPIIHWDELSAPTGGTLVKALLMLAVMAFAVFVYTRTWRTKDKPSRGAYLGLGVVIAAVMLIFIPLPDLAGTDGISSVFNGTKRLIQPGAFKPDNPRIWYYLILALMALSIFLTSRLRRSRLGRAWTAIREDELAANQMGVNPVHAKLLAFSMGATFSGFAGAFYGAYVSGIFPSAFEFSVSVIVLCSVVLGGLGNIRGVIFGAMAILLNDVLFLKRFQKILNGLQEHVLLPAAEGNFALREAIRANLDPVKYRFLLLGLVLVLIMSFRPEGLLPSKERAEELHAGEEPNVPVPEEDAAEMPSDEEVELR